MPPGCYPQPCHSPLHFLPERASSCSEGCLQYDDNGVPTDVAVLMLLAKAASTSGAARQMLHMGAEHLMAHLQQSRQAEVQAAVQHTLSAILAAPKLTVSAGSGATKCTTLGGVYIMKI